MILKIAGPLDFYNDPAEQEDINWDNANAIRQDEARKRKSALYTLAIATIGGMGTGSTIGAQAGDAMTGGKPYGRIGGLLAGAVVGGATAAVPTHLMNTMNHPDIEDRVQRVLDRKFFSSLTGLRMGKNRQRIIDGANAFRENNPQLFD